MFLKKLVFVALIGVLLLSAADFGINAISSKWGSDRANLMATPVYAGSWYAYRYSWGYSYSYSYGYNYNYANRYAGYNAYWPGNGGYSGGGPPFNGSYGHGMPRGYSPVYYGGGRPHYGYYGGDPFSGFSKIGRYDNPPTKEELSKHGSYDTLPVSFSKREMGNYGSSPTSAEFSKHGSYDALSDEYVRANFGSYN